MIFFQFELTRSGAAITILKKYTRALAQEKMSKEYFDGINEASAPELVSQWKKDIEKAERKRDEDVKAMDMMQNNIARGIFNFHQMWWFQTIPVQV